MNLVLDNRETKQSKVFPIGFQWVTNLAELYRSYEKNKISTKDQIVFTWFIKNLEWKLNWENDVFEYLYELYNQDLTIYQLYFQVWEYLDHESASKLEYFFTEVLKWKKNTTRLEESPRRNRFVRSPEEQKYIKQQKETIQSVVTVLESQKLANNSYSQEVMDELRVSLDRTKYALENFGYTSKWNAWKYLQELTEKYWAKAVSLAVGKILYKNHNIRVVLSEKSLENADIHIHTKIQLLWSESGSKIYNTLYEQWWSQVEALYYTFVTIAQWNSNHSEIANKLLQWVKDERTLTPNWFYHRLGRQLWIHKNQMRWILEFLWETYYTQRIKQFRIKESK